VICGDKCTFFQQIFLFLISFVLQVLLGSELIKSSSEERSLLKNLGSWLGRLTIGRNYVLRAREIDPKSLIVEAYEKGLMIAVIPFTSKVGDG
jgi:CCR4-NOT transcription complex subunit 1